MGAEILGLDEMLVACVKPAGVPSQPDPTSDEDMTAILRGELERRGESGEIFTVHRLDRATGGVMIYARSSEAAAKISAVIADKDRFEKEYLAVVSGVPEASEGRLEDFLYRDSNRKKAFVVKKERRGAKRASLDYRVTETVKIDGVSVSLLKIRLNTGRFHQIRVQLASRGMPILGDGKYGSRIKSANIALWSHKISFELEGKSYCFFARPPILSFPWKEFKSSDDFDS